MKALVTGVDGYIGSLLAPFLLERGHEVIGLDTGFYRVGWLYNLKSAEVPRCLNKDTRQVAVEGLRGLDAVVHLAELSNDPLGQLQPSVTYDINRGGSVELARKCREAGVPRFVYTSSCSVYGIGSEEFKTEESETNPQTVYSECKVLVEQEVSKMASDRFSPTFLRNATAYGPSPRMRFDLVLNNLCGAAWTTGQIRMTSDGTPWRPLVHVLDICEAIACTLEAPRDVVHNEVFNVGDNKENYRVKEIAEIVARVFPECEMTFGTAGGDTRTYRVSFNKIHDRLPGFRCRRDALTGAGELHALFERIGLSREMFESRAFTRLRQLEYLIKTGQLDDRFFWRQQT
jgi:nucleoside-diphosphate-sugar epimerase